MIPIPNWCDCELTIKGDKAELRRFKEFAYAISPGNTEFEPLDFNQFVPQPPEVVASVTDEHAQRPLWYEWRVKNWGTKWGPRIEDDYIIRDRIENSGRLMYKFDTAWSPPTPVVLAMSRMFSTLEFELEYWEGSVGFHGVFKASNGQVRVNQVHDYSGPRGG